MQHTIRRQSPTHSRPLSSPLSSVRVLRASLTLRFQPHYRPFVLVLAHTCIRQNMVSFEVYINMYVYPWITERLDRKLADAISSNIVGKCDVTLSRAIQPLTSDVLRVFN